MDSARHSLLPAEFRARPSWAKALSYTLQVPGISFIVPWVLLVDSIVAVCRLIRGLGFQFQKLPGAFSSMKYSFFFIYVVILGVRHGLQQVVHSELNAYIPQDRIFSSFDDCLLLVSNCSLQIFLVSVPCTAR